MKTIIAAHSGILRGTGASILSALSHLSSLPWLARSKIERHLQMISVYQWVITFLIMGITCSIVMLYIFFTKFWPIAALYFSWLVIDWSTPKQGGRRSEWVRNWAVWRYFREYFPIRLVKTHNLDPTRNYIFGCHPHGIFSFGAFCNFGTEATGFSNKFPGIRPFLATLAGNFRMPILREYLMSGGIFPVTREAIDFLLSKSGTGNAVIIVIGGSAESLNCSPGSNVVTLKNRKGFVKMALQNGADLVPVYTFGENDVYRQIVFKEGSLMRVIQRKFQKLIGFAPCVFQGRGFFSSNSWGLVPYAKPINTVVGEPITVPQIENPSQEEVDIYHKMYICSLGKLFNKYKTKFGYCETDRLKVI
ncbi:diacylglycerol O-acyltransferase 2 isoform X2 [Heterodontus francisci]|uniref:diacylglycerol O-acyltransferase 2 isoform X2 n=1 Tax=Heterodontus francisci TaxID=7792 RepID=UPI00355B745A